MSKAAKEVEKEKPLEAMVLECKKDRYKLSYAAIRWAKEIKMKENLPEPVPHLVPRALREILTGKVLIKDIEKLSVFIKVAPPPPLPSDTPSTPTITLNTEATEKPSKKDKKDKDE